MSSLSKFLSPTKKKRLTLSLPPSQLTSLNFMPQLPPRPSKEVLEKSRFHGKNTHSKIKEVAKSGKPLYTQILSKNIRNILKIKEIFPELSDKKIKELNKTIFSKTDKLRPRINITTKSSSYKQIIIPISSDNTSKFISLLSKHIANFN